MAIGNSSNSGLRIVKWMLLIINFMFMITGILLVLVGTTIHSIFVQFDEFVDSNFYSPPALMIAIGIIMFAVSVFGCVGAIKQSTILVNIFGCLLFLIFILEISAGIAAFCLQGQIKEMITRTMQRAMENYETSDSDGIDFVQSQLQCCGIYNSDEWDDLLSTSTEDYSGNYTKIPPSCCSNYNEVENLCTDIYRDGCFVRMQIIFTQSAMLIATGAITVAFVEFLGILCAFMLAKTIRRNKTLRDVRRWQLQQNLGITLPGKLARPPEGYVQMENTGITITKNEP